MCQNFIVYRVIKNIKKTKQNYTLPLFLSLPLSDEKSFESGLEHDRGFFTEQSLLSTSRPSPAVASLFSLQASPSQMAPSPSPLDVFHSPETVDVDYLCAPPLQCMFSTPEVYFQRHWKASGFEQVLREQDASHMSWDVSLIKFEENSPRVCVEPVLKQTSSPQLQPLLPAEDGQSGSDWDIVLERPLDTWR